ncbi:hypothetical protein ACFFLZ_05360 [Photobacterium aphoticum]|nr:hypothetical protein [Photobacterium aphoticum]GHA32831.1 hypothetical protein GCM10007086_02530 [Photobacterium aphoticum]
MEKAGGMKKTLWALSLNHMLLVLAAFLFEWGLGFESGFHYDAGAADSLHVWYGGVLFPLQWLVECIGVGLLAYAVIIAGETQLSGLAWPVCLATGGFAAWYALV